MDTSKFASLLAFLFAVLQPGSFTENQRKKHCEDGRIYFGNVDETLPQYLYLNGVYELQEQQWEGNNVYKHTSGEAVMFYMPTGRWMISPKLGDWRHGIFMVRTRKPSPAMVTSRHWSFRRGKSVPQLKSVCARPNMHRCTSGTLRLVGLKPSSQQSSAMGQYDLLSETHNQRPVYQHRNGRLYLYYNSTYRFWLVGADYKRGTQTKMFVVDAALRPEQIVNTWNVYRVRGGSKPSRYIIRRKRIKVQCSGPKANSNTGGNPCDQCQNGASCAVAGTTLLCGCKDSHFGPFCEQAHSCGPPSGISGGTLVTKTGTGRLDIAIFNCSSNARQAIQVCDQTKKWVTKKTC